MRWATLGKSAQDLLEAFATKLDGYYADQELDNAVPVARYVAQGQVAWDGPSLTLIMDSMQAGQPGQQVAVPDPSAASVNFHMTVYVQLLREAPSDFNIDWTNLGYAGRQAWDDAAALLRAAVDIQAEYLAVPAGEAFGIGPLQPLGPDGGFAAMRIALTMTID